MKKWGTPEYQSYRGMIGRCYFENCHGYERYGGAGVIVCERWRHSFDNFLEDMGYKPDPQYTIERLDSTKNYEPNNCKWASRTAQAIHRKTFKNNTSGTKGVIRGYGGKWRAFIHIKGKKKMLGTFVNFEDAVKVRKEAEQEHYSLVL